jgi:hypothetical protein
MGSDDRRGLLRSLRPTWVDKPAVAGALFETSDDMNDDYVTAASASLSNSRIDVLVDGNYHRITLNMEGDYELNKVNVDIVPMGTD